MLRLDAWRSIKERRQEEGQKTRFNDLLNAMCLRNGRRKLKRLVMTRMFRFVAARGFGWRTGVMHLMRSVATEIKSHLRKP